MNDTALSAGTTGKPGAQGYKCLVTGGSGYVGSVLVRELIQRGHSTCVLDIADSLERSGETVFFQGDIRDETLVRQACEGVDVVYHAVAKVPLAKNKKLYWSVNYEGTERVLRAALESKVKKVVYISSSAVFGIPPKNPVDDSVEPNPREEYGRSKLITESMCKTYIARGMDIGIIRPRTVLGPGRLGIFQLIFEWIWRGYNVPVLGGGNNLYQFVHADDLADACIRVAEKPGSDTYNVGAESFCTMRECLESLIEHSGSKSRVKSLPFSLAVPLMHISSKLNLSPLGAYHSLMYGRSMYFDNTKAISELGWLPKHGNIDMLRDSYDWYTANRDALSTSKERSPHRSLVKPGLLTLLRWVLR